MRLYLIRHAEPDYENHTITEAGHLEAEALAERLAREGIDHIYCSTMERALHTMQYTAKLVGINAVVMPWMAELQNWKMIDTAGQEQVAWNMDGEWIRETRPVAVDENWLAYPPYLEYGFQEKYEDIQKQSDRFFATHGYRRVGRKYEILQGNTKKIAVFCHLGFGLSWLAHLLELPLPLVWSGFWLAPSSVTTILMDERSEQWAAPRCIGLGDTSHLYHTHLPTSPMGIISNFE